MKTIVIFRTFKSGEVFALFPEVPADHVGNCQSYAHTGQHGAAFPGAMPGTRPATPEEYAPLRSELERIGYSMEIRSRVTPTMDAKRRASLATV